LVIQCRQFGIEGTQDPNTDRIYTNHYNHAGLITSQKGDARHDADCIYYSSGYVKNITDLHNEKISAIEYDNSGNRSSRGLWPTTAISPYRSVSKEDLSLAQSKFRLNSTLIDG